MFACSTAIAGTSYKLISNRYLRICQVDIIARVVPPSHMQVFYFYILILSKLHESFVTYFFNHKNHYFLSFSLLTCAILDCATSSAHRAGNNLFNEVVA